MNHEHKFSLLFLLLITVFFICPVKGPVFEPAVISNQIPTPIAHQAFVNVTFGGIGIDEGITVVECTDGGIAIAGHTNSFGIGDSDFWLIRTDANGNHMWDQRYGSLDEEECWDMIECSDGGFALIGMKYNITSNDHDIWVVRTNSTGQMEWNQTYGGSEQEYGTAILEYSGGGFTIAGWTQSFGPGIQNGWVLHIDDNGTPLWNQTYGGALGEYVASIIECNDGGYSIAGHTNSYGAGENDAWLVRTDATGMVLWNQTYGGSSYDIISDHILCSEGGFTLVGFYDWGHYCWLVRTDAGGNLVWNKTYGIHQWAAGRSLIEVGNGGFAIAGEVDKHDTPYENGWLLRTNDIGNPIWNTTYQYGSVNDNQFMSIVESQIGGFIIVGYVYTGIGNVDVWLVRVPEDIPPTWVEAPTNQVISYGTAFRYDLNATDAAGIDTWWVNDTTLFTVDSNGVITDTIGLGLGNYGVRVSVNDTNGNELEGTFSVTVEGSVPPPIPGFPFEAIVLGLVLVFISFIAARDRKNTKKGWSV